MNHAVRIGNMHIKILALEAKHGRGKSENTGIRHEIV